MEPQVVVKTRHVRSAKEPNLQMYAKQLPKNNTVTMNTQVVEPTRKMLKSDTSNYRSSRKTLSKIKKHWSIKTKVRG